VTLGSRRIDTVHDCEKPDAHIEESHSQEWLCHEEPLGRAFHCDSEGAAVRRWIAKLRGEMLCYNSPASNERATLVGVKPLKMSQLSRGGRSSVG
jgi:hypothetical protein